MQIKQASLHTLLENPRAERPFFLWHLWFRHTLAPAPEGRGGFDIVIAYASILEGTRQPATVDASLDVYTWENGVPLAAIGEVIQTRGQPIRQVELTPNGWRLESPAVLDLLAKLRAAGTPLGEYVNGRFYYRIKTGFNEAFVVDRATRERLISEHASSEEVLKPFLRGKDVKRW